MQQSRVENLTKLSTELKNINVKTKFEGLEESYELMFVLNIIDLDGHRRHDM